MSYLKPLFKKKISYTNNVFKLASSFHEKVPQKKNGKRSGMQCFCQTSKHCWRKLISQFTLISSSVPSNWIVSLLCRCPCSAGKSFRTPVKFTSSTVLWELLLSNTRSKKKKKRPQKQSYPLPDSPVYSGKQMLSADFLIFSANRSFLLRKRMMEVSMKNLLLQMESNSIRDSCMRFCRRGRRRRRLMAGVARYEVVRRRRRSRKKEGESRGD